MSVIEHSGPWYLMVGLDGKAVRVVGKGAVVAGLYTVVEVVPADQLRGAVEALRWIAGTAPGRGETANAARMRERAQAALDAIGGQ